MARHRIAITQRVVDVVGRGERRDALDQRWAPLAARLDALILPVPNLVEDGAAWIGAVAPDLLVLSGGNDLASLPEVTDTAPERDVLEAQLVEGAMADGLPVLGVCRGMQFLVNHFGGRLAAVDDHAGTEHVITVTSLGEAVERRVVASYHRWGVRPDGVPREFRIVATADDGTVEGIAHATHPMRGIMWHPERGEAHDDDLAMMAALLRRER